MYNPQVVHMHKYCSIFVNFCEKPVGAEFSKTQLVRILEIDADLSRLIQIKISSIDQRENTNTLSQRLSEK